MKFIPTTATAVEKFKRLAKSRQSSTGEARHAALDAIAREHGYPNWHHVTICADKTAARTLPKCLLTILQAATQNEPARPESQQAFADGLVIAMDAKEADGVALTADWAPCDDGWYLAARDLWVKPIHCPDSETGETAGDEFDDPQELAEWAMDDLSNYRLFRYVGARAPADLTDASRQIRQVFFFPPHNIWLRGEFIDSAESTEVRMEWRRSGVY